MLPITFLKNMRRFSANLFHFVILGAILNCEVSCSSNPNAETPTDGLNVSVAEAIQTSTVNGTKVPIGIAPTATQQLEKPVTIIGTNLDEDLSNSSALAGEEGGGGGVITESISSEEETSTISTTTTGKTVLRPVILAEQHATCPALEGNYDSLTQVKFAKKLMNECRYDRLTIPVSNGPQIVKVQIDLKHIEAVEQLQFKTHMLVQYRYMDERLAYEDISPTRGTMVGEELFTDKIWIPHIVIANEKSTAIMGTGGNDVLASLSPQGQVIYSYRMTAHIYCWMDLKKFPFDEQICDIIFRSWTHNASQLLLRWDDQHPVQVAQQLHLTEFALVNHWTLNDIVPAKQASNAVVGNFSALIFKFHLAREVGYYLMDYFIPSIMLVCTSWVTFWLQADNAAPRVTLGTSTMLSFITLASGQSKTLPKVSYIKASEIWFLGCTIFIFASIAEFAFVNIIWRRKKQVELKKVNSKYILKSTLTPKLARRQLHRTNSVSNMHKSQSCSNLNNNSGSNGFQNPAYNNYLTVHSFQSIPIITTDHDEDGNRESCSSLPEQQCQTQANNAGQNFTTMTPQEIAIWIDRRSRIVFPCMFLIFNILYWTFVYVL